MRIESTYNRPALKSRKTQSASGGESFSPEMGEEPTRAESSSFAAPVGAMDTILALQGVDDPMLTRKRAVKHGQSLLDVLEEMKADLIIGNISEGRVNRLLALITRARDLSDPDLEDIIADIELRARVELAKLGH